MKFDKKANAKNKIEITVTAFCSFLSFTFAGTTTCEMHLPQQHPQTSQAQKKGASFTALQQHQHDASAMPGSSQTSLSSLIDNKFTTDIVLIEGSPFISCFTGLVGSLHGQCGRWSDGGELLPQAELLPHVHHRCPESLYRTTEK